MRIRALALRIILQFIRDKRTLALLFLAPLLILSLMKLVFDGQAITPDIGTVNVPQAFTDELTAAGASLTEYASTDEAQLAIEHGISMLSSKSTLPDSQSHSKAATRR
jgi:ABC-2 type transport system permease protein